MLFTMIVIAIIVIALQFPIVMSSPITALGFAVLITVSLGSAAAKVGTVLAPLPIFALILVSIFSVLSSFFFVHLVLLFIFCTPLVL